MFRTARHIWLLIAATCTLLAGSNSAMGQQPAKLASGTDVFGLDKVWRLLITLSPSEYDAMQPATGGSPGRPGAPIPPHKAELKPGKSKRDLHRSAFGMEFPWVVASLTSGGTTLGRVGLRYKGNATYGMSNRFLKRPFKLDINRHDDKARFHGLKTLTLNCGVFDPSKCRETLAYSIYRTAGVPTPRTALAEVSITVPEKYERELLGVYTLIEEVDKSFLKSHFNNNAGLLMKPERIPGLVFLGEDWERYKETYRPNRDATAAEQKRVIDFTRVINGAPDAQFSSEIEKYLDVDAFLRFIAVTAITSNLDGVHSGHNYYLYLNPETNRFHFIPWDLDVSLGAFPFLGEKELANLSLVKPYPGQSKLTERLLSVKAYDAGYRRILKELAPVCFAKEKLLAQLDTLEKTVKPLVARESAAVAARRENPPIGNDPTRGTGPLGHAVPNLRTYIEQRTQSIAAQNARSSNGFIPTAMGMPAGMIPPEMRRKIAEALGPPFLVFHPKLQSELDLSGDQKGKLDKRFMETIRTAMPFFEQLGNLKPEEGAQKRQAFIEQAQQPLNSFLRGLLQPEQMKRLHQVMLQREGIFALGNPEIMQQLKLTDSQRQQFFEVVQEMQRKSQALAEMLQNGGKPEEFGSRMQALRREHEARVESLLTTIQKRVWQELLGRRVELGSN